MENTMSEKQNQIILNNNEYPQYISAAAGTGKTEVLINKILYILKNEPDASLENFGIITFTNKAADELAGRLSEALYKDWAANEDCGSFMRKQAEITSMTDICTIHSFCESLLREYGLCINLPLNFRIKSFRKETNDILSGVVNEFYDNRLFSGIPQFKMIKLLDELLTYNSDRGYVFDKAAADNIKMNFDMSRENEFWRSFKTVYLAMYQEAEKRINLQKKQENILTPNDLIMKTVSLLHDEYAAGKISSKYKYLFIDEFQDTNKAQREIINILIKNNVKIFAVGDDKQSIYAFRGADSRNSSEMQGTIRAWEDMNGGVYMNENFRTDKALLDIINKIFGTSFMFNNQILHFPNEPMVFPKEKIDAASDKSLFGITYDEPIDRVIENIISTGSENKEHFNYGDIAILCRSNSEMDRISSELKSKGYPVEPVGGSGFYRTKEIIDTYKLFNAVINKDTRYRNELIFTDYYAAVKSNTANIEFEKYLSELEIVFQKEPVEEILNYVYEKSCIFDYYRQKGNQCAISNLQKLKDISRSLLSKEYMHPIRFTEYMYIMIRSGRDEDEAGAGGRERENGVIGIYSVHKAKGLSFPIVIIPNIEANLNRSSVKPSIILDTDSSIPRIGFNCDDLNIRLKPDKDYEILQASNTVKNLEEEIRIFYVACTRARHKLILCSGKDEAYVKKTLNWYDYASVIKWLTAVDNGSFLEKYKINFDC